MTECRLNFRRGIVYNEQCNPNHASNSKLGITASALTKAYSDTGFNNGYAKGKFDITHGQPPNDTCLPKGLACDQFQSVYVTAINQYISLQTLFA